MRVLKLFAVLVLLASAPAVAGAQQSSPDSIRPQDTEPSIPVQTPTLGESAPGDAGRAAGQQGPDTPVSSSDSAAGAPIQGSGADARSDAGAGLPERSAAPRTLRAHWHVYIAFTVAWVLLFGYAVSLGWRMSRLERELTRQRGAR